MEMVVFLKAFFWPEKGCQIRVGSGEWVGEVGMLFVILLALNGGRHGVVTEYTCRAQEFFFNFLKWEEIGR